MRFSLPSLAALLVFASATLAHADSFQTFTLAGTLTNGGVTGTVTLDQTTGQFTSESALFVTSNNGSYSFNESSAIITGQTAGFSYLQLQNGYTSAYIEINLPSLVGYTGGQLCTTTAQCPSGHVSNLFETGVDVNFTSGTLTPVSASTPEPSSLVLLGTGALGMIGATRRRFFKA